MKPATQEHKTRVSLSFWDSSGGAIEAGGEGAESSQSGGYASLVFTSNNGMNPLTQQVSRDFEKSLEKIKRAVDERGVRALVVYGEGRAFSAGGDFKFLRDRAQTPAHENRKVMRAFYESFLGILNLPIPTIAIVDGPAVGAGFCVMCACDFRFATPPSRFGANFARLGLFPGMGATALLKHRVGVDVATRLLIRGEIFDAETACKLGLVEECRVDGVSDDPLHVRSPELLLLLDSIEKGGPRAIQSILAELRPSKDSIARAMNLESYEQSCSYASKEYLIGLDAVQHRKVALWDQRIK